ncbi:hypothetical protein A3841_08495 [Pontibacter flavimaris]|uniref:Uncharacterized protein n=1 Tax=Pontibacter flavimaris TaxID=1797110 RepID=A0A1Q5PII9_9BACT|nr:hypothetical protein A3841_08495 [Pontibacter flavimaris]
MYFPGVIFDVATDNEGFLPLVRRLSLLLLHFILPWPKLKVAEHFGVSACVFLYLKPLWRKSPDLCLTMVSSLCLDWLAEPYLLWLYFYTC